MPDRDAEAREHHRSSDAPLISPWALGLITTAVVLLVSALATVLSGSQREAEARTQTQFTEIRHTIQRNGDRAGVLEQNSARSATQLDEIKESLREIKALLATTDARLRELDAKVPTRKN